MDVDTAAEIPGLSAGVDPNSYADVMLDAITAYTQGVVRGDEKEANDFETFKKVPMMAAIIAKFPDLAGLYLEMYYNDSIETIQQIRSMNDDAEKYLSPPPPPSSSSSSSVAAAASGSTGGIGGFAPSGGAESVNIEISSIFTSDRWINAATEYADELLKQTHTALPVARVALNSILRRAYAKGVTDMLDFMRVHKPNNFTAFEHARNDARIASLKINEYLVNAHAEINKYTDADERLATLFSSDAGADGKVDLLQLIKDDGGGGGRFGEEMRTRYTTTLLQINTLQTQRIIEDKQRDQLIAGLSYYTMNGIIRTSIAQHQFIVAQLRDVARDITARMRDAGWITPIFASSAGSGNAADFIANWYEQTLRKTVYDRQWITNVSAFGSSFDQQQTGTLINEHRELKTRIDKWLEAITDFYPPMIHDMLETLSKAPAASASVHDMAYDRDAITRAALALVIRTRYETNNPAAHMAGSASDVNARATVIRRIADAYGDQNTDMVRDVFRGITDSITADSLAKIRFRRLAENLARRFIYYKEDPTMLSQLAPPTNFALSNTAEYTNTWRLIEKIIGIAWRTVNDTLYPRDDAKIEQEYQHISQSIGNISRFTNHLLHSVNRIKDDTERIRNAVETVARLNYGPIHANGAHVAAQIGDAFKSTLQAVGELAASRLDTHVFEFGRKYDVDIPSIAKSFSNALATVSSASVTLTRLDHNVAAKLREIASFHKATHTFLSKLAVTDHQRVANAYTDGGTLNELEAEFRHITTADPGTRDLLAREQDANNAILNALSSARAVTSIAINFANASMSRSSKDPDVRKIVEHAIYAIHKVYPDIPRGNIPDEVSRAALVIITFLLAERNQEKDISRSIATIIDEQLQHIQQAAAAAAGRINDVDRYTATILESMRARMDEASAYSASAAAVNREVYEPIITWRQAANLIATFYNTVRRRLSERFARAAAAQSSDYKLGYADAATQILLDIHSRDSVTDASEGARRFTEIVRADAPLRRMPDDPSLTTNAIYEYIQKTTLHCSAMYAVAQRFTDTLAFGVPSTHRGSRPASDRAYPLFRLFARLLCVSDSAAYERAALEDNDSPWASPLITDTIQNATHPDTFDPVFIQRDLLPIYARCAFEIRDKWVQRIRLAFGVRIAQMRDIDGEQLARLHNIRDLLNDRRTTIESQWRTFYTTTRFTLAWRFNMGQAIAGTHATRLDRINTLITQLAAAAARTLLQYNTAADIRPLGANNVRDAVQLRLRHLLATSHLIHLIGDTTARITHAEIDDRDREFLHIIPFAEARNLTRTAVHGRAHADHQPGYNAYATLINRITAAHPDDEEAKFDNIPPTFIIDAAAALPGADNMVPAATSVIRDGGPLLQRAVRLIVEDWQIQQFSSMEYLRRVAPPFNTQLAEITNARNNVDAIERTVFNGHNPLSSAASADSRLVSYSAAAFADADEKGTGITALKKTNELLETVAERVARAMQDWNKEVADPADALQKTSVSAFFKSHIAPLINRALSPAAAADAAADRDSHVASLLADLNQSIAHSTFTLGGGGGGTLATEFRSTYNEMRKLATDILKAYASTTEKASRNTLDRLFDTIATSVAERIAEHNAVAIAYAGNDNDITLRNTIWYNITLSQFQQILKDMRKLTTEAAYSADAVSATISSFTLHNRLVYETAEAAYVAMIAALTSRFYTLPPLITDLTTEIVTRGANTIAAQHTLQQWRNDMDALVRALRDFTDTPNAKRLFSRTAAPDAAPRLEVSRAYTQLADTIARFTTSLSGANWEAIIRNRDTLATIVRHTNEKLHPIAQQPAAYTRMLTHLFPKTEPAFQQLYIDNDGRELATAATAFITYLQSASAAAAAKVAAAKAAAAAGGAGAVARAAGALDIIKFEADTIGMFADAGQYPVLAAIINFGVRLAGFTRTSVTSFIGKDGKIVTGIIRPLILHFQQRIPIKNALEMQRQPVRPAAADDDAKQPPPPEDGYFLPPQQITDDAINGIINSAQQFFTRYSQPIIRAANAVQVPLAQYESAPTDDELPKAEIEIFDRRENVYLSKHIPVSPYHYVRDAKLLVSAVLEAEAVTAAELAWNAIQRIETFRKRPVPRTMIEVMLCENASHLFAQLASEYYLDAAARATFGGKNSKGGGDTTAAAAKQVHIVSDMNYSLKSPTATSLATLAHLRDYTDNPDNADNPDQQVLNARVGIAANERRYHTIADIDKLIIRHRARTNSHVIWPLEREMYNSATTR